MTVFIYERGLMKSVSVCESVQLEPQFMHTSENICNALIALEFYKGPCSRLLRRVLHSIISIIT
uniref:Uncharacterized protein n=1 Tax=Anguilla anguilla TaxID=7936 RepID=A0A0E9WR36_ANGAN